MYHPRYVANDPTYPGHRPYQEAYKEAQHSVQSLQNIKMLGSLQQF